MGTRTRVVAPRAGMGPVLATVSVALLSTTVVWRFGAQGSHDLIAVQVPSAAQPEGPVEGSRFTPTDRYVDGARIVRLPASGGAPVILTPEFAGAVDPDVSFDGAAIVFAGKRRRGDSWQIWRMRADGSAKEQITRTAGHSLAPVHAGNRFYLDDDRPTPQIIYVGTAHGWATEGAPGPALALYGTDLRGEATRRLTFNLYSDFGPDVLPTGRIVFTSWQRYGDRHPPGGLLALMDINIDGTDFMPFYGNHEPPPYKDMVRVSDADDRVYFVEAERPPWLGGGGLAFVSWRRPLRSVRRLSRDAGGWFHSPCPLPDGGLIASYRAKGPGSVFALYRIDPESGERRERLFEQAGWHTVDAQVLAAHPAPPGRSNWLVPGSTTGVFYSLNSYRTSMTDGAHVPPGAVKYVRVIEGVPPRQGPELLRAEPDAEPRPASGAGSAFGARRLLGVAPVAPDGSFHLRVPAETPLTFQLLDEHSVALRTQQAWTWVMGNENRGCIGCHEDPELSPPNRMVTAVIEPPVELTLPPERRRSVDFRHAIAPLVGVRCAVAGCHVAGEVVPNLAGPPGSARPTASRSAYDVLLGRVPGQGGARYVVPGRARESRLIWVLFGRNLSTGEAPGGGAIGRVPPHHTVRPRERIQFIEWVDVGASWDSPTTIAATPP